MNVKSKKDLLRGEVGGRLKPLIFQVLTNYLTWIFIITGKMSIHLFFPNSIHFNKSMSGVWKLSIQKINNVKL